MAKPNYSYEKRQREIAKKKQKEEKEARKREARQDANPATDHGENVAPADSRTVGK